MGDNEDNGDLLQKVPCMHCCPQCPQPCSRPLPTHTPPETPGRSRASLGQPLVGSLLLSPGSWCTQGSDCACQEFLSQSCASSGSSIVELMTTSSKRGYAIPTFTAARRGASAPVAVHCGRVHPQETQTQFCLSLVGSLDPGVHRFV